MYQFGFGNVVVSTHSRLKAAGFLGQHKVISINCFNTQPPEGGWINYFRNHLKQ